MNGIDRNIYMYIRILITEGGQHLGNNGLPRRGSDAYIQMAGLRLAVLNSLAGVGINGSRPAGVLHQNLSLGSQLQFVFAPIKNFYIELILQQANLMTHRRLGQIQLLSCLSIASGLDNSQKSLYFHVKHRPVPLRI